MASLGAVKEYSFRHFCDRRFRFDWAFPGAKIAVEYEGYGLGHISRASYTKDCLKYNLAALHGWQVIRISAMLWRQSPEHIQQVIEHIYAALLAREYRL